MRREVIKDNALTIQKMARLFLDRKKQKSLKALEIHKISKSPKNKMNTKRLTVIPKFHLESPSPDNELAVPVFNKQRGSSKRGKRSGN